MFIHQISRSHRLKNLRIKSNLSKITRPVAVIKSLRFALLLLNFLFILWIHPHLDTQTINKTLLANGSIFLLGRWYSEIILTSCRSLIILKWMYYVPKESSISQLTANWLITFQKQHNPTYTSSHRRKQRQIKLVTGGLQTRTLRSTN